MVLGELVEVPVVLEQQHRPIPGIPHGFAIKNAAHFLQGWPAAAHPAGNAETQRFDAGLNPVFVFQPVLDHFQLQLAYGRQDWIALALVGVIEHLHGPLFPQFVHPLTETFKRRGVGIAQPGKDFRAEARNALVFHLGAHIQGVANGKHAGIVETDHIAREGLVDHFAILAE